MEGVEYEAPARARDRQEVIDRHDRADAAVFPTSSVQRQFWLLHQLAPASAAYNIVCAFAIAGRLDASALRRGLDDVVRRHDVFRTTFATKGDQLVQVVSRELSVDLPVVDLAGLMDEEMDAAVREMVDAQTVRPFDLSRGPLVRALLLRRSPEDHVFVLAMHHIVTDLPSTNHFTRELAVFYEARLAGALCPLEGPLHQHAEYALWEQQWLQSEQARSMLSYWAQALRDPPTEPVLPTGRPRPAVQSLRGAECPLELPGPLSSSLKQLSRRMGMPPFVTLLSAYAVLLNRYARRPSIIVGVPFTNRRQPDFREAMGCFINILPVPIDLSGDPSFPEVARRVRQTMLDAHRNQEVTLESIVETLGLGRTFSYNPLYQAGFTFCPPIEFDLPGLCVEPLDVHTASSQLDLFASLWETPDGFRGRIDYSTDLFEQAAIDRFARRYRTLLESIVKDQEEKE